MNELTIQKNDRSIDRLAAAYLTRLKDTTRKTYRESMLDFARFCATQPDVGAMSDERPVQDVAILLATSGRFRANELVMAYKTSMIGKRMKAATIRLRLAALKALLKLARGIVPGMDWDIEVTTKDLPREAYADTAGCCVESYARVISLIGDDKRGRRDRAIMALLFDQALRRSEVASMNLDDVDLEQGKVRVLGKGREAAVWYELAESTRRTIEAWVGVRGKDEGPLFFNLDPGHKRGRLSPTSIYRMVQARGKVAKVKGLRPHKLRHAAITRVLELNGGDVNHAMDFSRHKSLDVLRVYNDNRNQNRRAMADLLASSLETKLATA
jgi:integrase/recombinase XerC